MYRHQSLSEMRDKRMAPAWGLFLARFPWEWFMTLTFRRCVTQELARREFAELCSDIERARGESIGWFVFAGRGKLGRIHLHSLMLNVRPLQIRMWESVWYRRAGTAKILPYDSSNGAAYYCARHFGFDAREFDFSDGLDGVIERVRSREVSDVLMNGGNNGSSQEIHRA